MNEESMPCASTLGRELGGFRLTKSRFSLDASLDRILSEDTRCQVVKHSPIRQVFYLQAPGGDFFLKRSTLVRTKDRLRHLLLPRRRWAEWRNLHRLRDAQIAAANPVLKGEEASFPPHVFFLLTEKVHGTPLDYDSLNGVRKLGEFVACLHLRGVYHADLHPENIVVKDDGQPCLIDAQKILFLPWLPRWLRIHNLGKLWLHLLAQPHSESYLARFLLGYNEGDGEPVTTAEVVKAAGHHQQRRYRSRTRRCCKSSTEFTVVKRKGFSGYKRRDFSWGDTELKGALKKGTTLKRGKVVAFQDVCIKIHHRQFLHHDRCLTSWKMCRALEVRGIRVPQSLAYFRMGGRSYFLAEFLSKGQTLNEYLSSLKVEGEKRASLKKLALWLKNLHDHNVWQRDCKSSNILFRDGAYVMMDLDGVEIRRHLHHEKKVLNLAQLNASLSNAVTIRDRLRFYDYYTRGEQPSREQRRAIYKEIWDISLGKNTAVFGLDLAKLKL